MLLTPEQAFDSLITVTKNFCLSGKFSLKNTEEYFLLHNTATAVTKSSEQEFNDAETARQKIGEGSGFILLINI